MRPLVLEQVSSWQPPASGLQPPASKITRAGRRSGARGNKGRCQAGRWLRRPYSCTTHEAASHQSETYPSPSGERLVSNQPRFHVVIYPLARPSACPSQNGERRASLSSLTQPSHAHTSLSLARRLGQQYLHFQETRSIVFLKADDGPQMGAIRRTWCTVLLYAVLDRPRRWDHGELGETWHYK